MMENEGMFVIKWTRNPSYGIGIGSDYIIADNADEALRIFWEGKNKEAFLISSVLKK